MDDVLTRLFENFDRGMLTRRQLLQALGLAAVAAPVSAFAQGRCGGGRAGTPECDTTPAPLPKIVPSFRAPASPRRKSPNRSSA